MNGDQPCPGLPASSPVFLPITKPLSLVYGKDVGYCSTLHVIVHCLDLEMQGSSYLSSSMNSFGEALELITNLFPAITEQLDVLECTACIRS